jgi:hypothetical protein
LDLAAPHNRDHAGIAARAPQIAEERYKKLGTY